MNPTRTTTLRLFRVGTVVLVALVITAYAVWRSLNYARGPEIVVFSPSHGASVVSTTTKITGQALRVKEISLNGKPISVDEQGNFAETIILFPGVNFVTITARDQFGRDTFKEIQIYRNTF